MSFSIPAIDASASNHAAKLNFPVPKFDALNTPYVPFVLTATVGNASTDITIEAPCALRIFDVQAIALANGGAGDTVQIKNGSNAVTDALDLQGADKAIVRASTIDNDYCDFAEGDLITVDPTDVTDPSCLVFIHCIAL